MKQSLCTIVSNSEVMPGTYRMWIEAPDIAGTAQPGQFVTVKCGDFVLRRPLSIHQVGSGKVVAGCGKIGTKQSQIALLFNVVGKGTLWLSRRQKDERIDILGPFGKGFSIAKQSERLLLVAGGIGIAPLVFLLQRASFHHEITIIHGASTTAQLYPFSSIGMKQIRLSPSPKGVQFIPVTEDGSAGRKGMATDILPDFLESADQLYACGPLDMYEAMALSLNPSPLKGGKEGEGEKRGNLKLATSQVSLEVRMGCGFGACYGCTINTRKGVKRVCRDGPVFELGDIIWQEVKI
jgi:dihydroorotate dehydrogenase electron transfer subunit